jgi:hypothetical protein
MKKLLSLKIVFSKKTRELFEKATPKACQKRRGFGEVANSMNRYQSYQAITCKSYAEFALLYARNGVPACGKWLAQGVA